MKAPSGAPLDVGHLFHRVEIASTYCKDPPALTRITTSSCQGRSRRRKPGSSHDGELFHSAIASNCALSCISTRPRLRRRSRSWVTADRLAALCKWVRTDGSRIVGRWTVAAFREIHQLDAIDPQLSSCVDVSATMGILLQSTEGADTPVGWIKFDSAVPVSSTLRFAPVTTRSPLRSLGEC